MSISPDDKAYLVFRRWPRWTYGVKHLDIVMDKEKVGHIDNGKEQVVPVPPGCHVVELQLNRLFRSQRRVVDLKAGERVVLEFGTPLTVLKLILFIVLLEVVSMLAPMDGLQRVVAAIVILLVIGYSVWKLRERGKQISLQEPQAFR